MTDAFPTAGLPDLSVDQMREVDRIMIDVLDIGLLQMMENAGRNLADLAISRYTPTSCLVLAAADCAAGVPAHHGTFSSECA